MGQILDQFCGILMCVTGQSEVELSNYLKLPSKDEAICGYCCTLVSLRAP